MSPTLVIALVASFVAASCALVGSFLVLRRLALVGDAISHAVLPGIVLAFLVTGSRAALPMVIGAGLFGVVTVLLVELASRSRRLREDASIGVVFPALFAIGVILVSRYADAVDLDLDCVLYGEIAYAPWDTLSWSGRSLGPKALWVTGGTLLFDLAFVLLLFKELKLAAFDSKLAAALGFAPALVHYLLMAAVSITVVGAFESVGAILVVAMLIVPPATAYLLTDRLWLMLVLAVALGVGAALGGYASARVLDCSIAGAMATTAGVLFLLAFLFAPAHGTLARRVRHRQVVARVVRRGSAAGLLVVLSGLSFSEEPVRPLSADRPDTTESASTVPRGLWQLEGSLVDWTRDGGERRWLIAPFNLKYGLDTDTDVQLAFVPYTSVREEGRVVAGGTSDIAVRLKHNLWGNDGGPTALAIMPWISLPTGSSALSFDRVQGGVIVPLAIETSSGLGIGAMAEVDLLYNDADDRYGTAFVHTVVVGTDLSERWGGYLEYAGVASWDLDAGYVAFLDAGVTFGLSSRAQFDAGVRVGLTDDAADLGIFLGYTVRLPR